MLYYKFVLCILKLFIIYMKPLNSDYYHKIFVMIPNLYKQVIEFKSYFDIFTFSHKKSFLGVFGQICREDLDPWL